MLYLQRQGGIQVGIVGSGSYEQSWRAIPTQRPGPRDMYPVLSGNLQDAQPVHQADGYYGKAIRSGLFSGASTVQGLEHSYTR